MAITRWLAAALISAAAAQAPAQMPVSTDGTDPNTWDLKLEARRAAPRNHKVIFENQDIRVLSVSVQPGEQEALHHHRRPSVMVIDSLVKLEDYDARGKPLKLLLPDKLEVPLVLKLPPQAAHSIRNVDSRPFHAIRIEFKNGFPPPGPAK